MTVSELYDHFQLNQNLRLHQLRVAYFTQMLLKAWTGPVLDKTFIVVAALTHDLGNLVKFDLEKHYDLLGPDVKDVGYWRKRQLKMIQLYGKDEHIATLAMLEAQSVRADLIALLTELFDCSRALDFSKASWPCKLVYYADSRTGPVGYVSLAERKADALERYPDKYTSLELDTMFLTLSRLEADLDQHITVSPLSAWLPKPATGYDSFLTLSVS